MKKINSLYKDVNYDINISGIKNNYLEVVPGDLFVCISKNNTERYYQVDEAIKRGAVCVVVDGDVGSRDVLVVKVDNPSREYPYLVEKYYDLPDLKLKTIGITGTEGKSSVGMIIQCLLGKDICGFLDEDYRILNTYNEKSEFNVNNVYKYLDEFVKFNCYYAVVEAGSKSLVDGTLKAMDFDVCVYTNIMSDHLDVHGSFDNYFRAKLELFQKCKDTGIQVLNKDDIYFSKVLNACKGNVVTYGKESDCTLQIVDYKCMYNKTSIVFKYKGFEFKLFSPLLGDFNVYNLAAALLTCLELGVSLNVLLTRIEKINIPNHLIFLKTNNCFKVMVDYAHTVNSIYRLLSFINSLNYSSVYVVVGQEGEVDKFRRSGVGEIVVKNSTYAIFTSDNNRSEDPNNIINDITANIKNYSNYEVIVNRDDAIKKAINMAYDNDIVLILGKYTDINRVYSFLADRNISESSTEE